MKKPNEISTDCDLDRRAVLKFGTGISAFAVASHGPVSAAVLDNNNEIVALSARSAVDYVRRGDLSAERYAQVLLDRWDVQLPLIAQACVRPLRPPRASYSKRGGSFVGATHVP
jgi:hypothetical protein